MVSVYSWRKREAGRLANRVLFWFQIPDGSLQLWSERVAQCLSDYASPACSKPDHRKLQWIVSRRTAQNLHSHRSVPELPTIPEDCWDESERSEVTLHTHTAQVLKIQSSFRDFLPDPRVYDKLQELAC